MYNPSVEPILTRELPRSLAEPPGPYRETDLSALPEDWHGELLWGHLVVSPSPGSLHQVVLAALARRFDGLARAHRHLFLFAPIDVRLFEHTVCQPDLLLFQRGRRPISGDRLRGIPDLVVEIVSPSSGRRDRMLKLALYAKAGVPEFWLVDPRAQTIEPLALDGTTYRRIASDDLRLRSSRFPELEVDSEELWAEVDALLSAETEDG